MFKDHLKKISSTAAAMIIFSLLASTALSISYFVTKTPIEESDARAKRIFLNQVIPSNLYDNNLVKDTISVEPNPLIGNKKNIDIYRAKKNNQVIAVIIETIAPDGYSGEIKTLVGIDQEDKILGVRVIIHKETPGLGDYIEIEKGEVGVSEDIQNSEFVKNTNYFVDLGDIKFKIFKSENKWGESIIKLGGLDKARRLSWSKEDKDRFDVILANPPFGGKERKEVQNNFNIKTGETAFLFLQHFIKMLKVGGRAAVVIKNTCLL
jgi:electron transport complex protein RnfG